MNFVPCTDIPETEWMCRVFLGFIQKTGKRASVGENDFKRIKGKKGYVK